ncbi:MAG: hypothetical protein WCI52_00995 [bacterium]
MNLFRKAITLCSTIFLSFVFLSSVAFAQMSGGSIGSGSMGGSGGGQETPLGGQLYYSMYCECTHNYLNFFNDYVSGEMKKLVYEPGSSVVFKENSITQSMTYELGSYSSEGKCEIKIYPYQICIQITSDGEYGSQPGTGTSSMGGSMGGSSSFNNYTSPIKSLSFNSEPFRTLLGGIVSKKI